MDNGCIPTENCAFLARRFQFFGTNVASTSRQGMRESCRPGRRGVGCAGHEQIGNMFETTACYYCAARATQPPNTIVCELRPCILVDQHGPLFHHSYWLLYFAATRLRFRLCLFGDVKLYLFCFFFVLNWFWRPPYPLRVRLSQPKGHLSICFN